jgi:Holliday junction resolvase RusA-like endonuclease
MYTPAKTRDYEMRVRAAIPAEAPRPAVAVRVTIEATYPTPQRRPTTCPAWMWSQDEAWYIGRTDLDNVAKAVLDGLQRPDPVTGDRWLEDDRIVVELHATKRHGHEPGVAVEVSTWTRDRVSA